MAIKKGYCLNCVTNNEKNRIFLVNSEADICYCPNCMKSMDPKHAIKIYNDVINSHLSDANYYTRVIKEYHLAYETFGSIIELDSNCYKARLGRLEALLYLSTLRNSKLPHFLALLKEEAPKYFHYADALDDYFSFIKRCFLLINEYEVTIKKRLTLHRYFYDVDCVKLYFKRLLESIDTKEFFLKECKVIGTENDVNKQVLINLLTHSLEEKEKEIKASLLTLEGYSYSFIGFSKRDMVLGRSERKSNIAIYRYSRMTLSEDDKKKLAIRDQIYRDHSRMNKFGQIFLPLFFIFLSISILLAIATFVLFYFKITAVPHLICGIITASIFGLSLIFGTIALIRKIVLKKKRSSIH
ncbi:MAG: hypothetical protein MJ227_02165 [Bacilli bacterium]|nr:hypothetical protein [Bacilli bacterium]